MSDTVIQVDNLWKKYRLGVLGTGTLRHDFNRWWHQIRGKPDPYVKVVEDSSTETLGRKEKNVKSSAKSLISGSDLSDDEMWALRGVSFEVKRGEILGIIGRNGAGKSTLLKILSRVTAPSSGEVRVKGRIASLLEVGTGFHPELTGRENTFLNGAILGMTKAEIRKKFDEIVSFSGVERYIDTPVKRYSSGMYVRLAFAVAAHLEPEILIVDEVLAVGDAEFQEKCLGKMQNVSQEEGRTILFVSHNMRAVQTLCQFGIVLEGGRVKSRGTSEQALRVYSASTEMRCGATFRIEASRPSIYSVNVDSAQLEKGNLIIDVGFKSPFPLDPPVVGIVISSTLGTPVFGSNPRFHQEGFGRPRLSEGVLRMTANNLPVHGGIYKLSVWLGDWQTDYDEKRNVLSFEFKDGQPASHAPNPETTGFTDFPANWSVRAQDLVYNSHDH